MDYAKASGDRGEDIVRKIAEKYPYHQFILSDYQFKTYDGKYAQIDHIIFNENGIFVIEVKNYSGKIYGKVDEKEWTQVIGNKEYNFYNPVKQNWVHINKLKDIITVPNHYIKNIVVFPKADISYIYDTQVMDLDTFEKTVFIKTDPIMDWYRAEYYYNELRLYQHRIINYIPILSFDDKEREEKTTKQVNKCTMCGRFLNSENKCSYCDKKTEENTSNRTVIIDKSKIETSSSAKYCTKCGGLLGPDNICLFCNNKSEETKKTKSESINTNPKKKEISLGNIIIKFIAAMLLLGVIAGGIKVFFPKPEPEIIEYSKLEKSKSESISIKLKANANYDIVRIKFTIYNQKDKSIKTARISKENLKKDEEYIFKYDMNVLISVQAYRYECQIEHYE